MITRAKFFFPDGRIRFLRMRIAPSTITNAGLGCFTQNFIPKGAYGVYQGVFNQNKDTGSKYAWEIDDYDRKTGCFIPSTPIGFIDAKNPKYGNWTRYVNCGITRGANNMKPYQKFQKMYYMALQDISAGAELFIDYGTEFREGLGIYY